ncbi:MAG: MFS transporter [Mogibacterium sp.]|nr:MFS transporter [Mogibacterium sp.]
MDSSQPKKLSLGTLLSYGVGAVGEGIGYNVFFSFFSFFLTTQAGIKPAVAGVISALAVLWDAITDPIIGNWSDRTRNPRGRRRPFIMSGAILFGVSISLLFVNVNLPGGLKIAYYIVVNMFYWLALTICVIPHISLGSELSEDFDERTRLRSFAVALMGIGTLIAVGTPLLLVEAFTNITGSSNAGWAMSGVIYGVLTMVVYEVSCWLLRGKEPANPNLQEKLPGNAAAVTSDGSDAAEKGLFFRNARKAFRNKSLRQLIWITFFVNVTVTLASGLAVYLLTFTYGFNEGETSIVYALQGVLVIACAGVVGVVAKKLGKRPVMIAGLAIYAVSYVLIILLPISWGTIIVHVILFAIGNAGYWTMVYAMSYDTAIVEQLRSGERPDGLYTSLIGLFMKFGNAAGSLVVGVGLQIVGFVESSEVQSAAAVAGIRWLYGLSPTLFLVPAVLFAVIYPLTRERFRELTRANELREQGEPFDPAVLKGL